MLKRWCFTIAITAAVVAAMEEGSWSDVYRRAGGEMTNDVLHTLGQESANLDRLMAEHSSHNVLHTLEQKSADLNRLMGEQSPHVIGSLDHPQEGISAPTSQGSNEMYFPNLVHVSANEARPLATLRQRIALLEQVEATLEDKEGNLLDMTLYPAQVETDNDHYLALLTFLHAQGVAILYHVDEDFFLTELPVTSQVLGMMIPALPTGPVRNMVIVWKKDSALVQTNLRVLGAIRLGSSRDHVAVFSGLDTYFFPNYESPQPVRTEADSISGDFRSSNIIRHPIVAEDENLFEGPGPDITTVRQLVEQMLTSAGFPKAGFPGVVEDFRTKLPTESFLEFEAMAIEHLGRRRKRLYQLNENVLGTKIDYSTGDYSVFTGKQGQGFAIVFWQVNKRHNQVRFYGLARLRSHPFQIRCLDGLPWFTYVKPSAIWVSTDRTIVGQLKPAQIYKDAQ